MAVREYAGDEALIQIVDENDEPVGAATIPEARQKDLLHRVVNVIVENSAGQVLLQKRSETQDTYPNCWDSSARGHVDEGETYEQAGQRELKEEVGIDGFPLENVVYYRVHKVDGGLKINRFVKLFKVIVPVGTTASADEKEVSEVRWFSSEEVHDLISNNSQGISDGLLEAYEHLYRL